MRTSCPWRWRRWPTTTRSCGRRSTGLLELWQQSYQGELLILLPDTFGTTQFLEHAPEWVADWTGQRIDSKDPYVAGDEYIAWLERAGRDPRQKRLIASDALDVEQILGLHAYFGGNTRMARRRRIFERASDFVDERKWVAGAPDSLQRADGARF